jgi:hypothetical protein
MIEFSAIRVIRAIRVRNGSAPLLPTFAVRATSARRHRSLYAVFDVIATDNGLLGAEPFDADCAEDAEDAEPSHALPGGSEGGEPIR